MVNDGEIRPCPKCGDDVFRDRVIFVMQNEVEIGYALADVVREDGRKYVGCPSRCSGRGDADSRPTRSGFRADAHGHETTVSGVICMHRANLGT